MGEARNVLFLLQAFDYFYKKALTKSRVTNGFFILYTKKFACNNKNQQWSDQIIQFTSITSTKK